MIYGIFIYNAGLCENDSFRKLNMLYKAAAKRIGIKLEFIKNSDIVMLISGDNIRIQSVYWDTKVIDFVLFMDKDVLLARFLEDRGIRVFNSSNVIDICDNKVKTHQHLIKYGIKMPKTLVAPLSFSNFYDDTIIGVVEEEFKYPFIIKEAFGSFGMQVYLINNREEFISIISNLGGSLHIYQEFIASSFGRDIRAYVVGGEVVELCSRKSDYDFRSNINLMSTIERISGFAEYRDMAIRASGVIGSSFCAVDMLIGYDNEPILCEINSNAHINAIYEKYSINIADFVLEFILKNI